MSERSGLELLVLGVLSLLPLIGVSYEYVAFESAVLLYLALITFEIWRVSE